MANPERTQAPPIAAPSSFPRNALRWLPYGVALAVFLFALGAGLTHYARILRMQDLTGSSGDYSNYAEIARVAASGGRMYVDYWTTKPPGMFFVLTPFVALFGNTFFAINLATVVIIVAFVVSLTALVYALTRSPMAAMAAGALALIYSLEKVGPETTLLMSSFGTLAALLAVVGRGRLAWMVASGALFGMGVLTKQTIAIELPVLLALAYLYTPQGTTRLRLRAPIGILAGGATLALVVVAWAVGTGVFEAMWDKAFNLNAQYVLAEDGRWHFREDFWSLFERNFLHFTMRYLTALLVAAAVALVIFAVRKPQNRALVLVVLAWAALAFAGASAGRAFKTHYYFEIVTPFTLLFSLALARSEGSAWQWLALGALVFAVGNMHWRYAEWSGDLERQRMRQEARVLDAIAAHSSASDCLWTWGHLSYMNYLSGRASCASPAINGFMMDESAFPIQQMRIEYMNEIIHARPALHVRSGDWGYFPELEKYAERYLRDLVLETNTYELFAVDRLAWNEAEAKFGGNIALIGYDLAPSDTYCPGDTLQLAMTWRAANQPSHQYQMFAQVLTADETANVASYDSAPANDRPTDTWQPDEVILGQTFDLNLPTDIEPGTYKLVVGVYEVATLERVPVLDGDGQETGTYAVLRELNVNSCE